MSRSLPQRTPSTPSPGWVGRTLAAGADAAGWSEQRLPTDDLPTHRMSACSPTIPEKSWSCPDSVFRAHTHRERLDLETILSKVRSNDILGKKAKLLRSPSDFRKLLTTAGVLLLLLLLFLFLTTVLSYWNFSHGKFGFFSLGKSQL